MTTITSFERTFTVGGDLNINRFGFGAMRITGKGIWGPPKDRDGALNVLKRAVELGVNFIDTADSYGPYISEELIAEALYPYPADLVVATKGGLVRKGPDQWQVNSHPDHLAEALEGSLKRLKLQRIDLYQLHRIDPNVPAEQTFEFLKKAQEQGKIKHLGLSEVSVDDIKKAGRYFRVVSVQNKYSVDERSWEPVLEYCLLNNIAFIPWFPLNGGNADAAEKVKQVAEKHNATTRQVALNWLLRHAGNILLIPGTSSVGHLEENLRAADLDLTPGDMEILDRVTSQ